MLSDKLREGAQGRIFKILFWIIILSFIFTGVGGYLIPRLNTDPVTVGDYPITSQEWTNQYNRQTQQMQRMYGSQFSTLLEDPEYVNTLRNQVLENLIDNVAFNSAVFETDVRIGDEQVRDIIRKTPAFQKDGKFDNDLYLASVRNMGMDPEYFGEQMRLSITSAAISEPLANLSTRVMPYEVKILGDVLLQERVVDLYTLDPNILKADLEVTDAEAQSYYDNHQQAYMAPANVSFTYLLLDTNDLKSKVKITDQDIEDYYSLNSEDFRVGERREVSHILIRAGADAQSKVQAITDGLAKGEDFATLAREYSDDTSSKEAGGKLGLVGRGEIAANLEEALFALKNIGEVSAPISDNYGVHFLKLDAIKDSYVPELAEIKDRVRQVVIDTKASEMFQEQVTTLSDLSFENPDSLDVTAEALSLEIKDCKLLNQGDTSAPWPLNTKALQDAAFNEENTTSGVNTPVVTISEGVAVVMNINNYHERALREFSEVKDDVMATVLEKKAVDKGDQILETYAKALQQDPNTALPEGVSATKGVKVARGATSFDPEFGMAIFAIANEKGAFCVGENLNKATLAILQQVETLPEATLEQYSTLVSSQLANIRREEASLALYRKARTLSEITYNQEAIDLVNQTSSQE